MGITLNSINFKGHSNNCAPKVQNFNKYPNLGYLSKDTVSFSGNKCECCKKDEQPEVPGKVLEYLGEDAKYLDDAKEILKNKTFEFSCDDEVFEGTLQEYFEHSIINPKSRIPSYKIYHGTSKECVQEMLKGLDYTKTGRKKCGPGTYFTPGMGSAISYGGAILAGEYKGDKKIMPVFKDSFYVPVERNQEILDTLSEELGTKNPEKLLKVCAHDILADDMDIDMLYASGGRSEGCYVAVNDDCMRLSKGN